LEAAFEFYREFQISVSQLVGEIQKGYFKTQLPLHGGLALGICDVENGYALYRTFVSHDDLFQDQLEGIEADDDLNGAIQSIDSIQYKNDCRDETITDPTSIGFKSVKIHRKFHTTCPTPNRLDP